MAAADRDPAEPVRYRVVRALASGGTAEVLEALREPGGQRVVIKKLIFGQGGEDGDLRRFSDEVRAAAALHHPNLVRLLDWGREGEQPFLVLELVEGLDLSEAELRAGKLGRTLPPELALFIAGEVARGLHHAHTAIDAAGRPLLIVHRDLAPENVLISWAGEVKLTDFGLARLRDRAAQTAAGARRGRPELMAPEQHRGEPLDARTDVFGLGCLLCWMASGESPLGDDDARARLLAGQPPRLDPSLPEDVRRIAERALAPRPDQRFASAEEMAAACARALRARSPGPPARGLIEWMAVLRALTSPRKPGLFAIPQVLTGSLPAALRPPTRVAPSAPESPEEQPLPASAPAPSELIGRTLHGFRIEALIAAGGSAWVYAASHLHLPRRYAVKVLRRGHVDPVNSARLEREARLLSALRHPHVVAVHDFGTTEHGQPFLATELLEGRTLRELVRAEGSLSPGRAAAILRQLASALAAAHAVGLVHRDLKPSNVVITPARGGEHATVIDFGIARDTSGRDLTQALTEPGELLGTPAYMAPEQIKGSSAVGPPADLYALGSVLYFMLTGEPPFSRDVMTAIEGHLRREPPPLPPAEGLERLARELLAKDPAARPTAEQLLHRLSASPTPQALLQRSPSMVGLTIGAPLAIAALAVLWVALNSGGPATPNPSPRAQDAAVVGAEQPRPAVAPRVTPLAEADDTPRAAPPRPLKEAPRSEAREAPPRAPEGLADLSAQLDLALRTRGLESLAELELEGDPLRARETWARAVRAPDRAAAARALEVLLPAVAAAQLDGAYLKRRAARIHERIAALPEARQGPLDSRYLELRSAIRPGLSARETASLLVRLRALESEL